MSLQSLVAPRSIPSVALIRRARWLSAAGLAWHAAEFGVAVAAGVAASSIALIAFGLDSLVEAAAGGVVLWRFTAGRVDSEPAERRAQRVIALSFFVLTGYVAVQALRALLGAGHPQPSLVGMSLAILTIPAMQVLAWAKRRVGRRLGSRAAVSESAQNLLCAYLAGGLLAGLGLNALFGWWWADPAAALAIAGVALREGLEAWRGDPCGEVSA